MNSLVVWYTGLNTGTSVVSVLCCPVKYRQLSFGKVMYSSEDTVQFPCQWHCWPGEPVGSPQPQASGSSMGHAEASLEHQPGVKGEAMHRQSWGCIWGCNWNKGQWDSLHLNTTHRGRRAHPLWGLYFLQGYQLCSFQASPGQPHSQEAEWCMLGTCSTG